MQVEKIRTFSHCFFHMHVMHTLLTTVFKSEAVNGMHLLLLEHTSLLGTVSKSHVPFLLNRLANLF